MKAVTRNQPAEIPAIAFIGWSRESEAVLESLEHSSPGLGKSAPFFRLGEAGPPPGLPVSPTVEALFSASDFIFIAPPFEATEPLLPTMRLSISDRHTVVLLGQDWSLTPVLEHLHERKLVRCLIFPSTAGGPTLMAYHASIYLNDGEQAAFRNLFSHLKMVLALEDEARFEAALGLASFAPAAFITIIDALGDAALMAGLPRAEALPFIASLLLGSMSELLESGRHPALLREEALGNPVAAAGLVELESAGIRGLMMRAFNRGLEQNALTHRKTDKK